ncbi:InlB B-repeat-containing protein, partial [Acetobacterium malicum]|uniref:InlB B-repeat-containing protein n=1 Tax=Acetobacterium malicum TaxID=52692 RepID=UPI003593D4FB
MFNKFKRFVALLLVASMMYSMVGMDAYVIYAVGLDEEPAQVAEPLTMEEAADEALAPAEEPAEEEPQTPVEEPPAVNPEQPTVEPEQPAVNPEQPVVEPEQPAVEPEQPVVEPEQPAVEPEQPAVEPTQPVVETPAAPIPVVPPAEIKKFSVNLKISEGGKITYNNQQYAGGRLYTRVDEIENSKEFVFDVNPDDGYVVKEVKANEVVLTPNGTQYKMAVDEAKLITVMFEKLPEAVPAEPQVEVPQTENPSTEKPVNEEPKEDENKPEEPVTDVPKEDVVHEVTGGNYTVAVKGNPITITGKTGENHIWVAEPSGVSITGDGNIIEVTGIQTGKVTLTHFYTISLEGSDLIQDKVNEVLNKTTYVETITVDVVEAIEEEPVVEEPSTETTIEVDGGSYNIAVGDEALIINGQEGTDHAWVTDSNLITLTTDGNKASIVGSTPGTANLTHTYKLEETEVEATQPLTGSEPAADSSNGASVDGENNAVVANQVPLVEKQMVTYVETITVVVIEQVKPAAVLTVQTASGVIITVSAPDGLLPDGVTLEAAPVESAKSAVESEISDDKEIVDIQAFDIILKDKDGNLIENLNDSLNVTFALPTVEGDRLEAFYVPDGQTSAEFLNGTNDSNAVDFGTDHFSIYAFAVLNSTDKEKIITFDVTKPNTAKIIVDGQVIDSPQYKLGDEEKVTFSVEPLEGYAIESIKVGDISLDISTGTTLTDIKKDTTVYIVTKEPTIHTVTVNYVYASTGSTGLGGTIAAAPYVATLKENDVFAIPSPTITGYTADKAEIKGTLGTTDYTETVIYNPSKVEYKVSHWFEGLNGQYIKDASLEETFEGSTGDDTLAVAVTKEGFKPQPFTQSTIAADGSTEIRIKYDRETHFVYYLTDGGSYIQSFEAKYGQTVNFVNSCTRDGYTFDGWYTDPGLEKKAEASVIMGTNDINLYAKWSAKQVDYTVIYWKEKPVAGENVGYDYDSSVTKKAEAGKSLTPDNSFKPTDIKGFEFNHADSVTIAGDGSSIVNVYYDRKDVTLTFKVYNNGWKTVYTIQRKYEQSVMDIWPSGVYANYNWHASYTGNTAAGEWYVSLEKMPSEDTSFYGESPGSKNYEIYYCLENLDQTVSGQKDYQGIKYNYNIGNPIKFSYGSGANISGVDKYPITGFTYKTYTDFNNYKAYLYYSRNSYTISFNSKGGSSAPASTQVKFEASVPRPSTQPTKTGYKFGGWYSNEDCAGAEFDFGKMPANNVILYAKWIPEQYNISFDLNYDGGMTTAVSVDYNNKINNDDILMPGRNGFAFGGWYTNKEGAGQRYDFGKPVTGSVTLYAKWSATQTSYTVKYLLEGTNDELFSPKTVTNQMVGATVTEEGKPDSNNQYVPKQTSQSKILEASGNEFIFYYVPFQSLSYTVYYVYKDSSGNETELGTSITKTTNQTTVTESAKAFAGYTPNGYQITKNLSSSADNNITFYYTPNQQAVYSVTEYLQLINGSYEAKTSQQFQGALGQTVTAQSNTYPGHTINPKKSTFSGTVQVNGNLKLELYYDLNHYTINYDANGGTGAMSSQEVIYHSNVAVLENAFAPPQNKSFAGWNDKVDGSGTDYKKDDIILGIENNITFYAQWKENAKYSITFEAGDHGTLNGTTSFNNIYDGSIFGDAVTVPMPVANTGYEFVEWKQALPDVNSKVTVSATYVAQWKAIPNNVGVVGYNGKYDGQSHGVVVTPSVDGATIWYATKGNATGDDWST